MVAYRNMAKNFKMVSSHFFASETLNQGQNTENQQQISNLKIQLTIYLRIFHPAKQNLAVIITNRTIETVQSASTCCRKGGGTVEH